MEVVVGLYCKVNAQEVFETVTSHVCPAPACGKKANETIKFCPQCGTKIEAIHKKRKITDSSPSNLLPAEFESCAFQMEGVDRDIWLLDVPIFKANGEFLNVTMGDESRIHAMGVDMNGLKEAFHIADKCEKLQALLSYMKSTYGEQSIELKYGAVCHW
jgi:hypothetical protein